MESNLKPDLLPCNQLYHLCHSFLYVLLLLIEPCVAKLDIFLAVIIHIEIKLRIPSTWRRRHIPHATIWDSATPLIN